MNIERQQLAPLALHDFDAVRRLAFDACGISLHEGKLALVASRLERLVRKRGFDSFRNYVGFLSAHRSGDEFGEFIDHLTTNHSGFWREPEHFSYLREKILPSHPNGLRIWSAACATGEEPYTIAMCCLESGIQGTVSASDISRTALVAATRGEYALARLAPLPDGWRDRYFEADREQPGTWRVGRQVRAAVQFGMLNLLQPLIGMGQFDVIFCRNVMIYFEQATRDLLVGSLVNQLTPGGVLFTGHSESLLKLPPGLSYLQPATYRKTG